MNASKPRDIADSILADYIQSGRLKPDDRLPAARVLAEDFGVSHGTIWHAFSLLEQQGIVEKRHGSGCYVKSLEPQNGSSSIRAIGLVTPLASAEIMVRLYKGVESVASTNGYQVVIADAGSWYESERKEVERLIEIGCEAVILDPVFRTREEMINDYLKKEFLDFPIVLVDIAYPEYKRSQVIFDNYHAGYDMASYLIEKGHRRIVFQDIDADGTKLMHRPLRERYRGLADALEAADLKALPEDRMILPHVPNTGEPEESRIRKVQDSYSAIIEEMARKWKREADSPTAVMAIEDNLAIFTIQKLKELGYRVPDDICVVGADDLSVGHLYSNPRFPTTTSDFVKAGHIAAKLAFQQIKGRASEPQRTVLPVGIKVYE